MALPLLGLLPLIKYIPDGIKAVGKLFGKKEVEIAGDKAGNFIDEVADMVTQNKISAEDRVELEKVLLQHKERLQELELEKMKLEKEELEMKYKDVEGARQVIMTALQSKDEFVRQTRPKILRRMFWLIPCSLFGIPILVLIGFKSGLDAATMKPLVDYVQSVTHWYMGLFGTAFVGYTAARTIDKKSSKKEVEGLELNTLEKMAKKLLGKK